MTIAGRCLLLLAFAIVCETFFVSGDESKKFKMEVPEDCEPWTFDSIKCPGFIMEMITDNMTKNTIDPSAPSTAVVEELRSTVECSNNSPPYKYLRLANSKRNSLTLKKCPVPEHGSFGEGWPHLEIFKFENYDAIEPLTRQHFSGLTNIWTLILFVETIHPMADDIFNDLTNLTEMHLSVKHANKNMFKSLTKLEWLHISIDSSDLENFDFSELKNLPALKTLEITSTEFTRLTKQFFEGCAFVETLILKSNTINAIDANAFEPLTNLKHVMMKWNEHISLPGGLFSKNKKLETFSFLSFILSSDTITSIPSGFFSNLPNLREITIQSKLSSIPADLIRGSTNLELLDLRFNKLSSVPRNLLNNHTKLKTIELYGNDVENTPHLFQNKSPLTDVRFDYRSED